MHASFNVYTHIFLYFLFHMFTNCSKSLSDNCSGASKATFIKWDRLISDSLFHKRDLISFIFEKLLSTDAVVTGIVRQTVASNFRLGYIAPIMLLVTNS